MPMSVLKSEIKLLTLGEVGSRMDDRLETAQTDVSTAKGANFAATKIRDDINGLLLHVDKDVDSGAYDLEVAKIVKRYVIRAAQIAENHREQQIIFGHMARGKIDAIKESVAFLKSLYDAERKILDERVKQAEDAAAAGTDPEDMRRPRSIKEQRMSEDKAEAEAEVIQDTSDSEPTEPMPRKRRSRARNS